MAKSSDRCATPFRRIDTDNICGMTNAGISYLVKPTAVRATTATTHEANALSPDAVTPTTSPHATETEDDYSYSTTTTTDDNEEESCDGSSVDAVVGDGDDRDLEFETEDDEIFSTTAIDSNIGDDRDGEFETEDDKRDPDDITVRLEDFVGFLELADATEPFVYDYDIHMETAMLGAVMAFTACHPHE